MPQQIVFPCPSCGATLSVDPGAATAQCQFCGATAMVPAALRGSASAPTPPFSPLPPNSAPDFTAGAPWGTPYVTPIYNPVYANSNRVWRSIIGLNLFITGAVVVLTLCITAAAILPVFVFMIPGFWSWLPHVVSQWLSH